jgi:hypothetical protein
MRIGLYVNGGAHEREQELRLAARSLGHEVAVRNGAMLVAADFESDFDAVLADEDCADAVRALYADRSVPGDRMWRAGRPVFDFAGDEDATDVIAVVTGAPVKPPKVEWPAELPVAASTDPAPSPKGKAKR